MLRDKFAISWMLLNNFFRKFVPTIMPMDNTMLFKKLAMLPENLKAEMADFIDLLLLRNKQSGNAKKPKFGSGKGMFKMKSDFNDSLEDFKDYMH